MLKVRQNETWHEKGFQVPSQLLGGYDRQVTDLGVEKAHNPNFLFLLDASNSKTRFTKQSHFHLASLEVGLGGESEGPFCLGSIPSDGVLVFPGTPPASPPASYDLYLKATIGTPMKLSNLCNTNVQ